MDAHSRSADAADTTTVASKRAADSEAEGGQPAKKVAVADPLPAEPAAADAALASDTMVLQDAKQDKVDDAQAAPSKAEALPSGGIVDAEGEAAVLTPTHA